MNYVVKEAIQSWQREVDAEMVTLIEAGWPPFDAAAKARDIVTQRRQDRVAEKRPA